MSVRPRDLEPGISYYNGKGVTRTDAYAGALMEAIERHAAEYCDYEVVFGSYNALKRRYKCIRPEEIIVPLVREYHNDLQLEWIEGYDLLNNGPKLVPLNCVVCPYIPQAGSALFMASSNGVASGNSLTEALCHAICEVIERDAEAISMTRIRLNPAVRSLLSTVQHVARSDSARRRIISLTSIPPRAKRLVSKLAHAGLTISLNDLTSTAGIATIECTIVESMLDGSSLAYGGCGAHPDSRVAMLRAITEAAQSRITCIQGGREDLPQVMRDRSTSCELKEMTDLALPIDTIAFCSIPTHENLYIDEDVRLILGRMRDFGLYELIAFDLTHPDVNIPVVRVVVPRAEAWPVFHLHTGRAVFGERVSQEL